MKRTITSNELIVEFNYSDINKAYFFYKISTSEKYIHGGATFLDLADLAYVRSIVYERGKSFYLMTVSEGISKSGIARALLDFDGGDNLSILQLRAEELNANVLLQLFLNSLSNSEDEMYSYNNVSGKLLCYKPAWLDRDDNGVLWGLNCVEVKVNKDMCLQLVVHRMTSLRLKSKMKFEKRKLHEYPQYEFSYNNHTLRRVTGDMVNDKSNLIQKPMEGERGGVSFFDFSNYETFSSTKNGILYDITRLVRNQFIKYMVIEFHKYEINEVLAYNRKELEQYKQVVAQQLASTGINIVDEVHSRTSESYLEDLCEEIRAVIPGVKCSLGKRLSKSKVNIRYIHDKQFYGNEDPHENRSAEHVVQHITVENYNYKTTAAVSNILKELVIKQDIKNGRLSITNWEAYQFGSDWIFGTVIEKEYYFMKIHPDGSFNIQKMCRDLFNMTEYDAYMDYFGLDSDYSSGEYSNIIGLIKDSHGNINLIADTSMYTLPNFEEIGNILKNVSEKLVFNGKELTVLLRNVMAGTENMKVRNELNELIPKLELGTGYDKTAVMNLLKGMNTKKTVVKSVYEDTGILLYAYLRGEDARNEYLSGTIDINYFEISDSTARFCVGEIGAGMKYSVERASVVREIKAVKGSNLVFKELLPLMGVEFVRYGMLTVMPFPFKYLREYAMNEEL